VVASRAAAPLLRLLCLPGPEQRFQGGRGNGGAAAKAAAEAAKVSKAAAALPPPRAGARFPGAGCPEAG